MSSFSNCCPTDGACSAILRGIEFLEGQNNTSTNSTPVGTLQALLSDVNRQNANFDEINSPSGAVRQVRVRRIPRGTTSDVVSTIDCSTTSTSEYVEQCITVTNEAMVSFDVTKAELQSFCNDDLLIQSGREPSGFFKVFMDKMYGKMEAMRQYLNNSSISLLEANGGVNVSTGVNTPTGIDVKYCAGGGKVESGLQDIIYDYYTTNQLKGVPFIIGAGNFDQFNTSMAFGCCNQYGLNFAALAESQPYYWLRDTAVGTITGDANRVFVLAPGAVQFVTYNDFVIDNYLKNYTTTRPVSSLSNNKFGNTRKGVLLDPYVPNLMYDLRVREVDCYPEVWTIYLSLHFDLVFIPDTAYSATDALYQSNGVLKYIANCI